MYKNILRAADQYFGKGMPLPKNSQSEAPNALVVGEHLGSLGLVIAAGSAPVKLGAGKKITVALRDSEVEDGGYEALPLAFSFTFAAGVEAAEGDVVLQLVLPDCGKYLKVAVGTDDAAAAGTVDVFMNYLAR